MRELKFRVWDKRYKQYVKPYAVCLDGRAIVITEPSNDLETLDSERVIIEQYTDLKGKNGKEIYEGDIMSDKSIVRFAYDNEVGSCGCCVDEFWGSGFIVSNANPIESLEVVGNIHENPELLEEK